MKKKNKIFLFFALINLSTFSQVRVYQNGHLNIANATDNGQLSLKATNNGTFWSESYYTHSWGHNIEAVVTGSTAQIRNETQCFIVNNNGSYAFYVSGAGLGYSFGNVIWSDKNYKENINPVKNSLQKILELNPVSFNYKHLQNKTTLGLIAQEVENVIPEAVHTMNEGRKGIEYSAIIAHLIGAIKEQDAKIKELEYRLSDTNFGGNIDSKQNDKLIYLYQNKPNPFNTSSKIECYVPNTVKNAYILITDLNGKLFKQIKIGEREKSTVEFTNEGLYEGMFIYSLFFDDVFIDSKKMSYIKQ